MLKLSRSLPAPSRVDLGGGAYVMARPATSIDYELARQKAGGMAAAVATSTEAAALFADLTGRPLEGGVGTEDLIAAAHSLSLLFLACECITEIHGVAVGDDPMMAPLAPAEAALLVRDVQIANALEEKIFARIALEVDEGNGSPPSRGGAPGADGTIAAAAGLPANLAPPAGPDATAIAAPSSSIIH